MYEMKHLASKQRAYNHINGCCGISVRYAGERCAAGTANHIVLSLCSGFNPIQDIGLVDRFGSTIYQPPGTGTFRPPGYAAEMMIPTPRRPGTNHMSQQRRFNTIDVGPTMARRAVLLFIGKTAMLFLSLVFALLSPRILGPRGVGFYSFLYAVVFTVGNLIDVGAAMLLRRYIPDLLTRNVSQVWPLIRRSLFIKGYVIVVLFIGIPFVDDTWMYVLALFAGLASSLGMTSMAVLYAGGALRAYALEPAVMVGLRAGLVLSLGYLLGRQGIAAGIVATPVIVLSIFGFLAWRLIPKHTAVLHGGYWQYLKFGLVSYIADLAFVLSNRVAIILARHAIDDMAEIGFLGYAFMIYLMARHLTFVIGETSIPSIVRYYACSEHSQFRRTMMHVWRYSNILVFAAGCIIATYADPLIGIMADETFLQSSKLTVYLIPALIAGTLMLCLRIPLFARERSSRLLIAHGGSLILFIGSVFALHRILGESFAATHIALSFSGASIAGLVLMAINSGTGIPFRKLALASLKPAIAGCCTYLLFSAIRPGNHLLALVTAPGALAVYLLLLFLLRGMEWRDWDRALALLGKKPLKDNGI